LVNAVVFDVGETLINEGRQWRLWAEWLDVPEEVMFAVLGAVIEREEHHHRVFEVLRPGFDLQAARAERLKAGIPDSFSAADLYPDVAPCFHALRARGLRIGIAGNQPAGVEEIFRELGLPIDFVGSSAEWKVEKPAPAFFQRIVADLNMSPASIAYVGDRLDNDVLPALDAGMIAVFLKRGPWGFIHAQRPDASKAHLRIDGLSELPHALDRLSA
jgi:FMN phosphatase YigB (HAD superfamily)